MNTTLNITTANNIISAVTFVSELVTKKGKGYKEAKGLVRLFFVSHYGTPERGVKYPLIVKFCRPVLQAKNEQHLIDTCKSIAEKMQQFIRETRLEKIQSENCVVLMIGREKVLCDSLKEAVETHNKIRDREEQEGRGGMRLFPKSYVKHGKTKLEISYNGRLWDKNNNEVTVGA